VHQLVPEMVDELKRIDRVLFIDACPEPLDVPYRAYAIEPGGTRRSFGHHETAENLLAMARELEQHEPDAWMLAISPHSLDHGEELTDIARDHLQAAVIWVRGWLKEPVVSCTKSA
jgi:Ni,Fe-hydrogenase maturation factor